MKSQTIMIVEDSESQQAVIASLVKGFGFDTYSVASGAVALEACKAVRFAAVIMDINMPGMSGFECAKLIREAEQETGLHVPIVAVSAVKVDAKFETACRASGIDDFLAKPFESEALRKVLLRNTYSPQYPNLRLLPRSRGSSSMG